MLTPLSIPTCPVYNPPYVGPRTVVRTPFGMYGGWHRRRGRSGLGLRPALGRPGARPGRAAQPDRARRLLPRRAVGRAPGAPRPDPVDGRGHALRTVGAAVRRGGRAREPAPPG